MRVIDLMDKIETAREMSKEIVISDIIIDGINFTLYDELQIICFNMRSLRTNVLKLQLNSEDVFINDLTFDIVKYKEYDTFDDIFEDIFKILNDMYNITNPSLIYDLSVTSITTI